ncbi:MAG: tetratricopeptide repeat protein, partial [Myxococcales bacterium]
DAVALLVKALDERPRDEVLLFALGVLHEKRGEAEQAIARMRQVLAVNPLNASALNFIGYTWAELGQNLDEAEALIRKALELNPDNGAYVDSLGWVLYKKGDYP